MWTTSLISLIVFLVYHFRWAYQGAILEVRIYAGAIIITLLAGVLLSWLMRHHRTGMRFLVSFAGMAILIIGFHFTKPWNDYIASWWRYQTTEFVELEQLPTTDYERILPLNAVYSLTRERMDKNEEKPSIPDLVRSKSGDYRWSIAIQPAIWVDRLFGGVHEVMSIPATSPSPDFSRKDSVRVDFKTGEEMMLGNNLDVCVRRAFGPWHFLSYEPGNVLYIQDDAGEWVQVVSLIKWVNVFFPWPEFGGVQIIRQAKNDGFINGLLDEGKRTLFGCGEFIPANKVKDHAFLRGQNLLAPEVARHIAGTIRFQEGFEGPILHRGDIRIPDLQSDVNQQPFNLPFRMPDKKDVGLFKYFALEPFAEDKQGLSASIFLPADGTKRYYRYSHSKRGATLIGVSAVATKVRESKKNYVWNLFKPVEHRPYIHDIPDAHGNVERRFLWLTTVVAVKEKKREGNPVDFIAGTTPELAITDAGHGNVVWVDPLHPEGWPNELRKTLGNVWAQQ